MSRILTLLLVAALLLGLVIALDPQARARAQDFIEQLNLPPDAKEATPVPTPSPSAPVPNDAEDSSDEPFIVINWDALGDSLRNLWESIKARFDTDLRKDGK